jgi:hypothetical protein
MMQYYKNRFTLSLEGWEMTDDVRGQDADKNIWIEERGKVKLKVKLSL